MQQNYFTVWHPYDMHTHEHIPCPYIHENILSKHMNTISLHIKTFCQNIWTQYLQTDVNTFCPHTHTYEHIISTDIQTLTAVPLVFLCHLNVTLRKTQDEDYIQLVFKQFTMFWYTVVAGRFDMVAGRFDTQWWLGGLIHSGGWEVWYGGWEVWYTVVAGRFDTRWWLGGLIHSGGLRYLFYIILFCFGEVIICSFIKIRNCS